MMSDLKYIPQEDRYEYLNEFDSLHYGTFKDSTDPKDQLIKRLLEDKANASRRAHRALTY